MRVSQLTGFSTIRTEGAILPAALLQRAASDAASLGGLTPDDYRLTMGEKLNEAANRVWNRMVGAWTAFQTGTPALYG
jgi:hypothetical protein